MLWYCRFTWIPGTKQSDVRERVARQHAAGTNHPEKIRGWYNLAGGGAGFLLIETDDPRELNEILEPYMDLVNFDVHCVVELPYDEVTEHFRQQMAAASGHAETAGGMSERTLGRSAGATLRGSRSDLSDR